MARFQYREDCHRKIEDLSRFRWHTGANPRPIAPAEELPFLFRDVGPVALVQFLRQGLQRLAGPMTPITYLRTSEYREPYTDYARIGRLVLLRPAEVRVWHSGLPHIYIASAAVMPGADCLGFVPGHITLSEADDFLAGAGSVTELRESFGGSEYDEICCESIAQLDQLNEDCRRAEMVAAPLRILYQTGTAEVKGRLRERLTKAGIDETDLCTAWHHLPVERRERMKETLPDFESEFSFR